jgi:hypothetical protein
LFCALALGPEVAIAQEGAHPPSAEVVQQQTPNHRDRDCHIGLNLRTDLGAHPLRLDAGLRLRRWDFTLVVDPAYFLDGQHDLDALASRELLPGWAVFGGVRSTAVSIADGTQWQESTLCGLLLSPPSLAGGHLRAQLGVELAILWLKHGGGLPTKTISASRELSDFLFVGMFARFAYASSTF